MERYYLNAQEVAEALGVKVGLAYKLIRQWNEKCLYYYGRECAKLVVYVAGALALLFMIHKLVSWALWVISL